MSDLTLNDLFVYGTLLSDAIVEKIIGRVPEAVTAVLPGFACYYVKGATFPGIIREVGGQVRGKILTGLTQREIGRLDDYEDDFYIRMEVGLSVDGEETSAQAYIVPDEAKNFLTSHVWTWEDFERNFLDEYRRRLG